jgi:hypothetical protein
VQGQYTVTVDGGHSFTGNGGGKGDVFNTSLFGLSGLAAGTHTVKLTNDAGTAGTYVDLDWAVVTLGDGHTGSPNDDVWVDDAAGNWTWGTNWAPGTNDLSPQYYQSTFQCVCCGVVRCERLTRAAARRTRPAPRQASASTATACSCTARRR